MEDLWRNQYWISQSRGENRKIMTTTEVKYIDGTFVVKLCGLNIKIF